MTVGVAVAVDAAVVPGPFGERFRLEMSPASGPVRGTVLALPPLFEEMNKSRRMAARFARDLARAGWRVVLSDLHGCGDSAGELREAGWSMWVDELAFELDAADAGPVWLWATRGGALLVPPLLARARSRPIDLLLWQPVTNGATHLAQFLRLHTAAKILGTAKARDEQTPAQRLKAGQTVEVGGYELNAPLASGVEQARFDLPDGFSGRVVWCELNGAATGASAQPPTPSPAAARSAEQLLAKGVSIELECMAGPHFWLTQEIEECDALIERSTARLQMTSARPGTPAGEAT